jgi:hypothetical protein
MDIPSFYRSEREGGREKKYGRNQSDFFFAVYNG